MLASFHVAAVRAVIIQLEFLKDKLEVIFFLMAMLLNFPIMQ